MTRHHSNGYSKVRSLIPRVKCDYSVQRIRTNTNNLTVSKHVTIYSGTPERGCITGALPPCPLKGGKRGHRCPYIPVSSAQ